MQPFNSTWIGVILGLILVTMPSVAKANDPGLCFIVTSSGKKISLGEMCKVQQPIETVLRIPIKRRAAKTPIIDVRFNGNQIFEMVFDTGASGILITQQMANVLKLKAGEKIKASIADGSIIELQTGTISSVSVGGLVVNNPKVAVAPKAQIGLLGQAFFDKYDIKIFDKYIELHQR
ncbi:MAG: aspartyl protease [Dolichospermum sp. JUN01]|jgi:aspartyl protease family protein|nr:aspartyl protease [Dolichospermum sp. JUN01]MBS9389399.1 retroviral-like aspartic protease family protein [Dolichospermum sp. WA123]MBS9392292.1 retroviral-like aspartic protease family protein [Dolichospermum sp. OL01]MCO5795935.1 retroviral-like aspartic protease family protein [Dolichospermum sp. OL03]MCS6279455.1 retroviral-like aspartic protease family protein [Dolichospermum sp.]QSV57592.1 MAG: aspartyl protease [Dolichospermum sp. LBC05a]